MKKLLHHLSNTAVHHDSNKGWIFRLFVLVVAMTITGATQARDYKGKFITNLGFNGATAGSDGYYTYDMSTDDNGTTYSIDIPYETIKSNSGFQFQIFLSDNNEYIVGTSNGGENFNIADANGYSISNSNYSKTKGTYFTVQGLSGNVDNYKSGLTITIDPYTNKKMSAAATVRYEFQKDGSTAWSRFDKYLYPNCFPLKIRRLDGTGTHYLTSSTATFATSGTAIITSLSDNESAATTFNYGFDAQNDYGYQIDFNSDATTATLSAANSTTKKYYLVFSNFAGTDNDPKHKSYLLFKPLRHRSGGAVTDPRAGELSVNKFVLNLKKDEIKKIANLTADGTVNYWIEDEDGNVYGANNESNRNLFSEATTVTKGGMAKYNGGTIVTNDKNSVKYIYNSNGFWLTANGTSKPTNEKTLVLDTSNGVSFTWILNTTHPESESSTNILTDRPILTQITNTKGVGDDTDGSDIAAASDGKRSLYVIGNFNDQRLNGAWNVTESTGRKLMERRIYYKSGTDGYTNYPNGYLDENMTTAWDATTMDSIVYSVTIARPSVGWSSLYLAFAPGNHFPYSQDNSDQWWGKGLIRPEGPWWGTETDNTANEAGMDVSSLRGGLFLETDNTNNGTQDRYHDNASQAIDPVVYAYGDPESYTLTVNVTTATYRIYFQDPDDHIYLVGPAVSSSNSNPYNPSLNEGTTWTAGTGKVSDNGQTVDKWAGSGLQFTYDADEQCYKYMVDGVETPIVFNHGAEFAFRTGVDFTKPYYVENSDVPSDLTTTTTSGTTKLDLINNYKAGETDLSTGKTSDTGYFDVLDANPGNGSSSSLPSSPMTWQMDGRTAGYTIRLYIKSIGDKSYSFYTVSRRFQVHNLGAQYDPTDGSKNEIGSDKGCQYWRAFSDYQAYDIPSGVKVYIVTGTLPTSKTESHYDSQLQGKASVEDITSLGYIPANQGVILGLNNNTDGTGPVVNDGKFDRVTLQIHVANPWATLPSDKTNLLTASCAATKNLDQNKHFAFNVIDDNPGFYYITASRLYSSNNSSFLTIEGAASSAKAYGMAYTFGVYDLGEATGIDAPKTVTTDDNDPYYTLMGVKLGSRPTVQGVYIHDGKKVVIK